MVPPTPHHRLVPQLGSTLELALFWGEAGKGTKGMSTDQLIPSLSLPCGGTGEEKMASLSHPLLPAVGKRAGPRVTRTVDLVSYQCSTIDQI